jgi:hypothetical protein
MRAPLLAKLRATPTVAADLYERRRGHLGTYVPIAGSLTREVSATAISPPEAKGWIDCRRCRLRGATVLIELTAPAFRTCLPMECDPATSTKRPCHQELEELSWRLSRQQNAGR